MALKKDLMLVLVEGVLQYEVVLVCWNIVFPVRCIDFGRMPAAQKVTFNTLGFF